MKQQSGGVSSGNYIRPREGKTGSQCHRQQWREDHRMRPPTLVEVTLSFGELEAQMGEGLQVV